ncbi:MAG: LysR family transcriptional regulator [Clostridia bacterium]|nr:LysR family transcriptional regulator [Clostridia bacterium]
MELMKLKYFYIVAKYEHMTKAAEEIRIAQPALTKTIKQLETELGVPLFYKKGRNIALTVYGKYLKNKLDHIFPQLEDIPKELEALREQNQNAVKLNVLSASTIVTDAVVNFKKEYPDTIFHIVQNEENSDCDISVTTAALHTSEKQSFAESTVIEENIYLAVPNTSKYAAFSEIALETVKNEGFVHLAGSRAFRAVCDQFCAQAGFRPQTAFESDSLLAVRNIIGASVGIGFWPAFSWGKTDELGMTLLPIIKPVCKREIVIALHRTACTSPRAAEFFRYLTVYMQSLSRCVND